MKLKVNSLSEYLEGTVGQCGSARGSEVLSLTPFSATYWLCNLLQFALPCNLDNDFSELKTILFYMNLTKSGFSPLDAISF